jgi:hypothetical protein
MEPDERVAMTERTRALFQERFSVDRMATALIDVVTGLQAAPRT